MATLRDQLLPVVGSIRTLTTFFGVRRFAVTIRRRQWTGITAGEGTATDYNLALNPPPRVRDITSSTMTLTEAELKALNSNQVSGNLYKLDRITPQYTNTAGTLVGFTAEQLRLWPNRDTGSVDNLVCLVGDDGYLRECVQVTFEQDDPFGYAMLVKEVDRPRTQLTSIALQPTVPTIIRGQSVQVVCTGTFSGGATSILSCLSSWSSSAPSIATVDIYGNVTAVTVGSANITATCLGQTATVTVRTA